MIFASIFPAFYIGHRCAPRLEPQWHPAPVIHPPQCNQKNRKKITGFSRRNGEKKGSNRISSPKWLVGWWLTYPSEKYYFLSWDDDIHNIWKVIKFMFQTTKQIWISSPKMMILLGGNGYFWQPFGCWFNHQKTGIWATQWWYFMKDINGNIMKRCINHDERDLIDGFNPSEKYDRHWGSSCQSYEWTNTLKPLSNKHMDGISPKKTLKPAVTWWYSHHTPPGLGHLGGLEANK